MYIETLTLVVTVIVLVLFVAYKKATKEFSYWAKRKVTYDEPVPFVGNYSDFFLLKSNLGSVARKIYEKYPEEKMVGCFIGNKPMLLIRDPDLIKVIMTKDFYYFYSKGFSFDSKKEPLNANLFSTSGDNWRVLRQNLTPLFSSAKMKNMFQLVRQCGTEFENHFKNIVENSDEIEVRDVMSRFTMDVIGSCAFGLQMNTSSQEENTFRRMGKKIFESSPSKSIKLFIRAFMPFLYNLLGLRATDKSIDLFFIDLVKKIVELRRENHVMRHDFIDLLMELKEKGYIQGDSINSLKGTTQETVKMTVGDEMMAAQSFIFFAAGFETSSTTMSYALYELAKNKKIQSRLQTEIDEILQKNEGKVTYESLNDATYLDMVINETLRKYPVLGVITRQCTSKYTFKDSNVTIDEGVRIHLPVLALHHDPKYYPEPENFDPQRFSPESKQNHHSYAYIPFGEGPRMCIGLRFGKMQAMVGLITVLKNFSVVTCDKTEATITFEPKAFVTTAKHGIWLKFVPRNKSNSINTI